MHAAQSTDLKVGDWGRSERAQVNGLFGPWSERCGSSRSEVQQSLAVKLLSQPAKRLASALVGNLGVELHGDRDLAVAEYPHRYPWMQARIGPGRCRHHQPCLTCINSRDPADPMDIGSPRFRAQYR